MLIAAVKSLQANSMENVSRLVLSPAVFRHKHTNEVGDLRRQAASREMTNPEGFDSCKGQAEKESA